jgi:hypothetical protein
MRWEYGDIKDKPYEASFITLTDDDSEPAEYTVDLENIVSRAVSEYGADNEAEYSLGTQRLIKIDKNTDFFINEIKISFGENAPEDASVEIRGYILER